MALIEVESRTHGRTAGRQGGTRTYTRGRGCACTRATRARTHGSHAMAEAAAFTCAPSTKALCTRPEPVDYRFYLVAGASASVRGTQPLTAPGISPRFCTFSPSFNALSIAAPEVSLVSAPASFSSTCAELLSVLYLLHVRMDFNVMIGFPVLIRAAELSSAWTTLWKSLGLIVLLRGCSAALKLC